VAAPTPEELFDEFRRRHPDRLRDVAPSAVPRLFRRRRRIVLAFQAVYLAGIGCGWLLKARGRIDEIDLIGAFFVYVILAILTFMGYECPRCGTRPELPDGGWDLNPSRCEECGAAFQFDGERLRLRGYDAVFRRRRDR
jgi:hypothetical protein